MLQTDIVWGDTEANIRKVDAMVAALDADLYVLPEMWSTGFSVHPEEVAEEEASSLAQAWMRRTAAERQCAVCGSLAVHDSRDGSYRNRLYFVTPQETACYDKRHLFTFAHEDEHYTRGDRRVIVKYGGMRFLLEVCYDLRFPLWSRWGRAGEYEAIVYVANWPSARQQAWDTLLRARAIENQCYVIGVNRVGQERKLLYAGGSAVIGPQGTTISTCQNRECVCQVDIDVAEVAAQRDAFPVLKDRDLADGVSQHHKDDHDCCQEA